VYAFSASFSARPDAQEARSDSEGKVVRQLSKKADDSAVKPAFCSTKAAATCDDQYSLAPSLRALPTSPPARRPASWTAAAAACAPFCGLISCLKPATSWSSASWRCLGGSRSLPSSVRKETSTGL
jgi:hypothetical protein